MDDPVKEAFAVVRREMASFMHEHQRTYAEAALATLETRISYLKSVIKQDGGVLDDYWNTVQRVRALPEKFREWQGGTGDYFADELEAALSPPTQHVQDEPA